MIVRQSELNLRVQRAVAPVRDQVMQALRSSIAAGLLEPGQQLKEAELCALTGASRTSVREALRHLEAERLIESQPNRGMFVATVSAADAVAIYQVREVLEGLAGRLFAVNASDEEIVKLGEAIDDFERAQASLDIAAMLASKARFYSVLVNGSKNEIVGSTLEALNIRITSLRATSLTANGRSTESLRELRQIEDAVRQRDPDRSDALCRLHVQNAAAAALPRLPVESQSDLTSERAGTGGER